MASMGKTWGKFAKTVRKARLNIVDEFPQNNVNTTQTTNQTVQNHRFHHLFPAPNQQRFTQPFSHKSYLLSSLFSPLSTQPITITTKEKKLER